MAVTTWGTLPKAQDDSTTVDQAIAAAINAHEADPEAHTSSGASLDLHRTNDVLDHPAGSVLGDKITASVYYTVASFDSLDAFVVSGSHVLSFPGVYLNPDGTPPNSASVTCEGGLVWTILDVSKWPFLQLAVNNAGDTHGTGYFGWGTVGSSASDLFFGFKYLNGQWYGCVNISGDEKLAAITLDTYTLYILRAAVDADTQDLVFYINGIEAARILKANYYQEAYDQGGSDQFVYLKLTRTNTDYPSIGISSFAAGTLR